VTCPEYFKQLAEAENVADIEFEWKRFRVRVADDDPNAGKRWVGWCKTATKKKPPPIALPSSLSNHIGSGPKPSSTPSAPRRPYIPPPPPADALPLADGAKRAQEILEMLSNRKPA